MHELLHNLRAVCDACDAVAETVQNGGANQVGDGMCCTILSTVTSTAAVLGCTEKAIQRVYFPTEDV
jgi:hypothetical protein